MPLLHAHAPRSMPMLTAACSLLNPMHSAPCSRSLPRSLCSVLYVPCSMLHAPCSMLQAPCSILHGLSSAPQLSAPCSVLRAQDPMHSALCTLPYALCPMHSAPCSRSLLRALFSMLHTRALCLSFRAPFSKHHGPGFTLCSQLCVTCLPSSHLLVVPERPPPFRTPLPPFFPDSENKKRILKQEHMFGIMGIGREIDD